MKKITQVITPLKKNGNTAKTGPLRVAAYARVSTDSNEQINSLNNQREQYEKKIKEHEGWEYVDIYYDEGITGLSTKKRDGFNRMIADAMDGKIDLIIVKSISRFARNTIDTLTYVRQLKTKGVGVIFEIEGYNTLNQNDEFIITILASYAQKESQEISERVTWSIRRLLKDGNVYLAYSKLLGYKRAGKFVMTIDKEQARIVKFIYKMYLEGSSTHSIAKTLTVMGIPTPLNGTNWRDNNILSILRNEKYIGDSYLQKTYIQDIISKKPVQNDGTKVPKYYVTDDHPAIIRRETFEEVQRQLEKRKTTRSSMYPLSNKIHCSLCGSNFYRHAYRNQYYDGPQHTWICTNRYLYKSGCTNVKFYESEIEYACHQIIKTLMDRYSDVSQVLYEFIEKTITPKKRHAQIKRCLKNFEFPLDDTVEIVMQRIIIDDIVVSPDRTAKFYIINNDIIEYKFPKWSVIDNAPKRPPKRKRTK